MEFTFREMLDSEKIDIWDAVDTPGSENNQFMGVNIGCPGGSLSIVDDSDQPRPSGARPPMNLANTLSLASCGPGNLGESLKLANCSANVGNGGAFEDQVPIGSANARRAIARASTGSGPRIVAFTADGGFIGAKDAAVLEDDARDGRDLGGGQEEHHLAAGEAAESGQNQGGAGAAAIPRRV